MNNILPLKENQEKCAPQVKELHLQILRSFVTNGRNPTREEMALWVSDVSEAIDVLTKNNMVTLSKSGELIGAYPFTMEEREYKVSVNGYEVHAMCALDALAIGPMFMETTQIESQCSVTGDPIKIRMSGGTILNLEEVQSICLGIAWSAVNANSCCADSLCMEMIFLRDAEIARKWTSEDGGDREVFTLQEAVQFASRYFVPLLN